MTDPVSSYRSTCRNADLMVGSSPAQTCGNAALDMVRSTNDGLRQSRLDAPTARAALAAGRSAYAAGDLPQDLRPRLAAALSELESRVAGLEQASGRHDDRIAPASTRPSARHGGAQAAAPRQALSAGLQLGNVERGMLPSEIQHSLFADRAQTTRTLSALASMTPTALRDLVTAQVGVGHRDAVLEALGDNARMQMRVRISERAQASLVRGAERLEQRSAGAGLEAALAQLRSPQCEPVLATLEALGADADALRGLIARQSEPDARQELTSTVADTMSAGATKMRELAQRYDAAHNVLDREGALHQLFPESVRQVGAQLGMPVDASRSALGSFLREDVAAAESAKIVNDVVRILAGLASAIATGGLGGGIAVGLGGAATRGAAVVGLAYERAGEMETAAAAGETDAESAAGARTQAHVVAGITVASALVGVAAGHAVEEHVGHAIAGAVEGGAELLTEQSLHVAARHAESR
jgi:hypothetical protein